MAKSSGKSASAKLVKVQAGSKAKGDVLVDVAQEVEVLTMPKAFSLVDELISTTGVNDFRLGGILAHVHDEASKEGGEAWLDGHTTFKELVDSRFKLHYRKATYLIGIYKDLMEKQIPWDAVKEVGWTKLKDLSSILTPKNVDAWVKRAMKMTTYQLKEAIDKHKNSGSDATEKEPSTVTTMTFKVHKDQKEAIREALNKVKKETNTEVDTVALHNMCLGYLGNAIVIDTDGVPEGESAAPALTGKKKQAAEKAAFTEQMKAFGWEETLGIFAELFPKIDVQVTA